MGRVGTAPEEVSAARETAERQVRHLSRLINDLMDVARINRGTIELRPEPIDLAEVARRAADACRPSIEERGHTLVVSLPDRPIPTRVDPTRIEQVLWNLLHNASKYTEPGGRIVLGVAREGSQGVVRVRDSGIGIDPDQLSRIFDPFMQAEVRRVRSRGGLGLGLSLVKNLVELHGGTVEARSDGPGSGSEFAIRLQVASRLGSIGRASEAAPASHRPPPPGRRVLIVDDNEDAANVLDRLLRRSYGQTVAVAHDGPSALELAREFRPDVVFLDIGLPGMDGHEVARSLRRLPETNRARLVALTGWGQEQDRRRSREAGFDHHLVKPAEVDDILRILEESRPIDG
jgi:two-component system CheB/CheR fusion protein